MPVPRPTRKEEKDDFISRCIRQLSEIDIDRPHDQIVAICYSQWRRYGKRGVRGGDRSGGNKRPLWK